MNRSPDESGPAGATPGDDLVVDLPSPRRPVTAGILSFWLTGWVFGLVFMVQQLRVPGPLGPDRLFLFAWMVLWAAAGVAALAYLLWLLAGRERVLLERDSLVLRRGVWGVWWTRRWPLASIRRLRTFGRGVPPVIAVGLDISGRGASGACFESGGRVVRFARTLNEHDAHAVVNLLRARHDFGDEARGGESRPGEPGHPHPHSAA